MLSSCNNKEGYFPSKIIVTIKVSIFDLSNKLLLYRCSVLFLANIIERLENVGNDFTVC